MRNQFRVGCDIGGTFTDFVAIDQATGSVTLDKVLTTPANPARGIFDGFDAIQERHPGFLAQSELLVHGTTLVINAIIERKGNKAALITTRGFRDVLEMRDELRYDVYDLQIEMPEPLISREYRYELTQRTAHDGRNIVEIDNDEVIEIIDDLKRRGIETVAVCLLHSYANPAHERYVGELLKQHAPEMAVSLSSDVLPEIKEYRRSSTTAANAYVKPLVGKYLGEISEEAARRSFRGDFLVMQSSSGVFSERNAREFPVRIIESGPAAGVALSQWWGRKLGQNDLLAFDMGGTTAKLCPIINGHAIITNDYESAQVYKFKRGSGISVNVPVVDLLEIGAGGGSIAHIDSLGLLKVGPESAGASPGPVCYDLGGDHPTVTDADLALGYLNADYFLGSNMKLDTKAAQDALRRHVADPLSIDLVHAAYGIHDLVNENMAAAARLHLAEMSVDASSLTMVASGGAGPVHALGVAQKLGCERVLIPRFAGVVSALGMLVADVAMDASRSLKAPLSTLGMADLEQEFTALEDSIRRRLPEVSGNATVKAQRSASIKYCGQGYAISIQFPSEPLADESSRASIRRRYEEAYATVYGRIDQGMEVEIETIKVVVSIVPDAEFQLPRMPEDSITVAEAKKGKRPVFIPKADGYVPCDVYDRYALRPGHEFTGPAIIEERETSIVVNNALTVSVDELGTIIIALQGAE